jgi:alcohol dehydrogenase
MLLFDFQLPTRIMFGPGSLSEIGAAAASLEAKRVLVVSDAGIVAAGHAPRAIEILKDAKLSVTLFDGVCENPTTNHVNAGVAIAKEFRPDTIVGIGGGSSMDCAKGINFVYCCGGHMKDYWGTGKATGPLLPMIAIPTTAGTGSETQSYALITDAQTHIKMACGDKRAAFRVAILDPELTLTQPPRVTALTGIDALSHALETFVTTRKNMLSLVFSREAWRRLAGNLSTVLADPFNQRARARMQLGACFAGLAIENSMLGAAHALANPLTAAFGVSHGEAIGVMLPHVIRRNGEVAGEQYRELVEEARDAGVHFDARNSIEALAVFVTLLSQEAGLAGTLTECGVPKDRLPELAEAATQQWTGRFNPVEMNRNEYLQLYEAAF